MDADTYRALKNRLICGGYEREIEWAANLKPCADPVDFFCEYSWVVINSGMKEQIARKIWDRIVDALRTGKKAVDVFGHKGKAAAIDSMRLERGVVFIDYQNAPDKLAFLQSLPWIGPITKYHLAKNLGHDCVKPDRHLVRIAAKEGKTPDQICREIAEETGDRLTVVDTVIWRAANLGLV